MAHILAVDNEERMCKIIKAGLEMDGHHVSISFSGQDAIDKLENSPDYDIVITDLKMSPVDGMKVLTAARNLKKPPDVILITAFASQQTALEAMRLGAFDYLIKPFEIDELSLRVNRILTQKRLEEENRQLKILSESLPAPNMVGKSERMRQVYTLINKVAETDATVLIRGESGTGKELVAEAVHHKSDRKTNNFIALNCAAVPDNLLESELFGYEKGAFTGAMQTKVGLFELAHHGTLFLDEVGDLPQGTQAKLLRTLQNKEIIRVGGTEKIEVDARLIAATNRNLEEMIQEGEFRSDLFYRINIFPIHTPPLRDHKEDLPELIQYFIARTDQKGISTDVKKVLMEYDWPGNVRELFNVLERAAIIADSTIKLENLPVEIHQGTSTKNLFDIPAEGINLDELEKNLIQSAIQKSGGNKTRAAQLLGITRRRLYSMMEKFNLGDNDVSPLKKGD